MTRIPEMKCSRACLQIRGRHQPAKNLSKTQKNLTDEKSSQHSPVLATFLIRREKEDYYAILLSSHNFPGAA